MSSELVLEIPEKFEVDKYTNHFNRKDKRNGVADAIHFILSYINKDGLKKSNTENGTPINAVTLREKVGKRNADDAMAVLIKNKIIEKTKNHSSLLKISSHYRLSNEFPYGKTKKTPVLGSYLKESINKGIQINNKKTEKVDSELSHLTTFLKSDKLNFDFKKAKNWLFETEQKVIQSIPEIKTSYKGAKKEAFYNKCKIAHLYKSMSLLNNISNIMDNEGINYTRASTNLRLNSDLTSMSKHLRRYLTYDGTPLTQLDLSASQPLLLFHLLSSKPWEKEKNLTLDHNTNQVHNQYYKVLQCSIDNYTSMLDTLSKINDKKLDEELIRYKNLFNGDFYSNIIEEIKNHNKGVIKLNGFDNRTNCKKTMMYLLFENFTGKKQNNLQYNLFKKTFPVITKILDTLKGAQKNSIALILQRLEAVLFLDTITLSISETNSEIPLFTIHDAILTTPEHVEFVNKVMTEILHKTTGILPKISIVESSTKITKEQSEENVQQILEDIKSKVRTKNYIKEIKDINTEKLQRFMKKHKSLKFIEMIEYVIKDINLESPSSLFSNVMYYDIDDLLIKDFPISDKSTSTNEGTPSPYDLLLNSEDFEKID